MSESGSPNPYRDEKAALQARVTALEEQLVAHEQGEDDEDGDPVIGPLLEQRRANEQVASNKTARWWLAGVVAVMLFGLFVPIGWHDYSKMALVAMGCSTVGVVFALVLSHFGRANARSWLPKLDAKIAAARRWRAEERALRAPTTGSEPLPPRVRVEVEDEAAQEEEDEAPPPRGRRKR